MKLAAIMTCHNRRLKTIACLQSLFKIIPDIDVYLTDDASTDGTAEMVQSQFPSVHIIKGSGNLFWNRGMHLAWSEAVKVGYDFYIWLNDDVILEPYFIEELLECNKIVGKHCVISGLIKDVSKGCVIYGGTNTNGTLIQESKLPQPIKYMNGNVVLVPQSVVEQIGIMDPVYWHDIGDVDYGLMAQQVGIPVMSTRKAVGKGYSNGKICRVRKWGTTICKRYQKLYSPLGSNPNISFYFFKKHKGLIHALSIYIYLHLINVMSDYMVHKIWGNKFVEEK